MRTTRMLCIGMVLFWVYPFTVAAQEDRVRAKVGIQIKSGEDLKRAKSRDRLKTGDLLRLYVHPEKPAYVYVVHTDGKTVTLLNMVEQRIQGATMVLPSLQEFYQVDGKSASESFTIICSPMEIKEVSALMTSPIAPKKWARMRADLTEKSTIDLTPGDEKPFALAGNVRGTVGSITGDPFMEQLQIFSGKSLVIKKYEFRVKQ